MANDKAIFEIKLFLHIDFRCLPNKVSSKIRPAMPNFCLLTTNFFEHLFLKILAVLKSDYV